MNSSQLKIQQQFFNQLESAFSSKSVMIAAVADTLEVGRNAVYRRIKGDTTLSAAEMLQLAAAYRVDLSSFAQKTDRNEAIYLQTSPKMVTSEIQFLEGLIERIGFFSKLTSPSITLVTPELPLAYEMVLPTLRSFKLYIYGQTSWDLSKWDGVEFSPSLIHPEAHQLAEAYTKLSFDLPTTHLLSKEMMRVTLQQIVHFFELGKLQDEKIIDQLFAELNAIIDHVEKMTNRKQRFLPGNEVVGPHQPMAVYQNELPTLSMIMLLNAEERQIQAIKSTGPDYLSTIDPEVVQQTQHWYEKLRQSATLLGPGAEKKTKQFFQAMRVRVRYTHNNLKQYYHNEKTIS